MKNRKRVIAVAAIAATALLAALPSTWAWYTVQTFGKGIVQIVMEVGDKGAGSQMTVAQYYTPERNAVHKIGITPDVEIPLEEGDNGMYDFADPDHDPQLKKALEVMEEKMK